MGTSKSADAKLAQTPGGAGRILGELLYRKSCLAASLVIAGTFEMRRLRLLRVDVPAGVPEPPSLAQERKRLLRQCRFADRLAQ